MIYEGPLYFPMSSAPQAEYTPPPHPQTPPQAPPSQSNCHGHLTGEEKHTALWIRRADSVLATPFPDSTHNNLNAIRHECVWCGLSALKMHNDKLKRVECCTKCRVKLPLLSSLHRCCCHFCLLKRQKDFSPYAFYVFFTSDCKVVIFLLKRMSKKNENVHFFPQSYWNEFWRWINYTETILSVGSAPITTYSLTSQTTVSAKWAPIEFKATDIGFMTELIMLNRIPGQWLLLLMRLDMCFALASFTAVLGDKTVSKILLRHLQPILLPFMLSPPSLTPQGSSSDFKPVVRCSFCYF